MLARGVDRGGGYHANTRGSEVREELERNGLRRGAKIVSGFGCGWEAPQSLRLAVDQPGKLIRASPQRVPLAAFAQRARLRKRSRPWQTTRRRRACWRGPAAPSASRPPRAAAWFMPAGPAVRGWPPVGRQPALGASLGYASRSCLVWGRRAVRAVVLRLLVVRRWGSRSLEAHCLSGPDKLRGWRTP